MVPNNPTADLYDPRRGDPPVRAERVEFGPEPIEPARTNYFTIYAIDSGAGNLWADAASHPFEAHSLAFFVPYQHIRFEPTAPVAADVLRFHANYLCVETFHAEVGCAGVLFNDPYGTPVVPLDPAGREEVAHLVGQIQAELREQGLAHDEATLAYLKLLLIVATRHKSPLGACNSAPDARHEVIAQLEELLERHYRELHAPADYAQLLHMTPKTLGRIVREQLGTTLTNLIQQRILTHAKWQLLHTLRPVKEIAREVGYRDELYFSRLFKKATGYSPTFFREFETEIRGGSNLSMVSGEAPIQPPPAPPDN